MNDEVKLLLKLILAQEEETEAGQKVSNARKRKAPEPESGIDKDPNEPVQTEPCKSQSQAAKLLREQDYEKARQEYYAPHENNTKAVKEVPIWEKYALTVAEASLYFHLSEKKLRQIVKADKYANYLIWNGGRVFIKRKLFEQFLNTEINV